MPLKAIIDGRPIIGPDLTAEEWAELKMRHKKGLPITMGCCGAPGHLRTSTKGTQHFYHAVDTGCHYAEESKEHLEIKHLIYRVCQSEGFETSVEFPSPDRTWISDVYAEKDGRKIVFEIQLSPISSPELESRDAKYRIEGIESYWLLDNFLGRSKEFASWYNALVYGDDARSSDSIPYLDRSFFETGTENHLFITKNIMTAGLAAKKQTLYTTNNPSIPLTIWVREVLKGNYRRYLEESAQTCRRKRELNDRAAPALIRFRDFYEKIVRDEVYQKRIERWHRKFRSNDLLKNDARLQEKFREIFSETDWLNQHYREIMAGTNGLFTWKKHPKHGTPYPVFRLEPEGNIRKLEECVGVFSQWEASFDRAMGDVEREIAHRSPVS